MEATYLSQILQEFRKELPAGQREEIDERKPTVQGLINSYTVFWKDKRTKSKRGKLMKYFTNVCSTLNSHEELLPSGSDYESLFTRVLKI